MQLPMTWVKTSERLPEYPEDRSSGGIEVLFVTHERVGLVDEYDRIRFGTFCPEHDPEDDVDADEASGSGPWWDALKRYSLETSDVTHWMHLPKMPEE